jgi:predicted Zn-dependent peptidase
VAEIAVSRHVVAGVPVFAVDGPIAPVPALGVSFRVGRVDETAPTSGITHLVEHLVLPARIGEPVDFNGVVDNLYTSMWASGAEDDLIEFLQSVGRLLRAPPLERVDVERRTLLAEEKTRSLGGSRQALALRYGPHGAGLSGYLEYGLRRITPDDVETWTRTRFTRDAAALWVWGVPVERLDLAFETGEPRRLPLEPAPLEDVRTPAVFASGSEVGICLSFVGERSPTTNLALEALADGLRQRLRYELGLSYSIEADTQPFTGSTTQLTVVADVADDDVETWLGEAISVLDALAESGPDPELLERSKSASRRYDLDPASGTSWAATCADFELVGRPFKTHAIYSAERDAVTEQTIAAYVARMRQTLLVLGPYSTPVPDGFEEYPLRSTSVVQGRRHRPKSRRDRFRRGLRSLELIVGDDGVTFVSPSGDPYTAIYDSLAVHLRAHGERTLLSHDGFFINLDADDWVDGAAALQEIDTRIADDRIVDMDPEVGRRDQVARLSDATFRRTWLVSEELERLPDLLEDDEELLLLAQATRGWRLGLLALTDRKLHFLYGAGRSHSFTADRGSVSVRKVSGSTLQLDHAGEAISLADVSPSGKALELAEELGYAT